MKAEKQQGEERMEYLVIRSRRRTFGLTVNADGVTVRVPLRATKRQISEFVLAHAGWIETHLKKVQEREKEVQKLPKLTEAELAALKEKAAAYIPERVRYFAPQVGVTYGRITIRSQKTRWGSCSARGNLNFNCLLMLAPPEVIDSVVVHELCHRIEMNHSDRFYAEVLRVYPDYPVCDQWLKKNGRLLMGRMKN